MKKTEKVIPKVIYLESLKSKKQGRLLPFIFQFLLLYMSLVGFLYCVSTSLNMPIELWRIMLIAFPCLMTSALFTLSKKLYIPFISAFGVLAISVLFILRSVSNRIYDAFSFCYNLTIHIVVEEGYTNYKSAMTENITDRLSDTELVSGYFYCVIIVLAVVFSVLFASTMLKKSLVWVAVLPCFIILTPSLFFGAVPSGPAFGLFISGIIGCYAESIAYTVYKNSKKSNNISQKSQDDKSRKGSSVKGIGYAARCAANGFCSAVVILLVSLSVSSVVYSDEVLQVDSIREFIDDTAAKFMNTMFYSQFDNADGAIGGLIVGDVLELKTPNFRDLPVMKVTTRTNTSLYLRGWIGDELNEKGWLVLNDEDTKRYNSAVSDSFNQYTQMYNYSKIVSKLEMRDAQTAAETTRLGFVYDTVTVKADFEKSLMVFVPSMGINNNVDGKYRGIDMVGDTVSFFRGKRPTSNTYTIDAALQVLTDREFYNSFEQKQQDYLMMANAVMQKQSGLNEEEQFMYDERKYSEYVRESYLDVPENTDFLKTLAAELTSSYESNFDKSMAIERYFKQNYSYAKSFATDTGTPVDKVRYMIETTKTGYCTYYATAMTLMLRSLDIPARYVTGYHAMVAPDTGKNRYTRNILDENYHAWVEVYFDGIGWLTFDPTPGIDGDFAVRDYAYLDDPNLGEQMPVDEVDPNLSDEPDKDNDITEVDPFGGVPVYVYEMPAWLKALIIAVAVLLLLAVACCVTVIIINNKFNRHRANVSRMQPTEMVSVLYLNILRLLGSLGYKVEAGESLHEFAERVDEAFHMQDSLTSVIDTLEMTQFSNNTVDEKTACEIGNYFDKLSTLVFYSLNVFKKYYYMATINKKKYYK